MLVLDPNGSYLLDPRQTRFIFIKWAFQQVFRIHGQTNRTGILALGDFLA